MRIGISGVTGLVGWHIACAAKALGHDVVALDRAAFESVDSLVRSLASVDAVVHAAGANRGPDDEVADANIHLASTLADALRRLASEPTVVFTNSTHIDRDTAYGRSKRQAAQILESVAPGRLVNLVLPGVFGEHGRPNYNSVVSTFAHQLAEGASLTINDDAPLELIHAQDVADTVIDAVLEGHGGSIRMTGECTSVVRLADRLTELSQRYDTGIVPSIDTSFDRALFNTMRSYRYPTRYPTRLDPKSDSRGSLVEVIKADTGGQSFLSWTHPGITRGNHFHRRKVERFVVVGGTARISIRRLGFSEVMRFDVHGESPVAIDIPTLHTHNITNTGAGTLTTLFWSDEIFDPSQPDTVFEEV